MPRIALGIEYDGRGFVGWQVQKAERSVQGVVESAIASVADEPVATVCAGRTDAGVHALCQVVHFDTRASRSERGWVLGCNSALPPDVNVCWAREVDDEFSARFSARSRSYHYLILNRSVRSSLFRDRAWVVYPFLDAEAMTAAAGHFLGERDFSAVRAAGCQARSPVRTVTRLAVARRGEWLQVQIRANAFLHHMVRNIVGILVRVGRGEAGIEWPLAVLAGRDRTLAGVTAPAAGLYLTAVEYPARFAVPAGGCAADPGAVLAPALPASGV